MMNQRQRDAVNRVYHTLTKVKDYVQDPLMLAELKQAEVDCVMVTSSIIDNQED